MEHTPQHAQEELDLLIKEQRDINSTLTSQRGENERLNKELNRRERVVSGREKTVAELVPEDLLLRLWPAFFGRDHPPEVGDVLCGEGALPLLRHDVPPRAVYGFSVPTWALNARWYPRLMSCLNLRPPSASMTTAVIWSKESIRVKSNCSQL